MTEDQHLHGAEDGELFGDDDLGAEADLQELRERLSSRVTRVGPQQPVAADGAHRRSSTSPIRAEGVGYDLNHLPDLTLRVGATRAAGVLPHLDDRSDRVYLSGSQSGRGALALVQPARSNSIRVVEVPLPLAPSTPGPRATTRPNPGTCRFCVGGPQADPRVRASTTSTASWARPRVDWLISRVIL